MSTLSAAKQRDTDFSAVGVTGLESSSLTTVGFGSGFKQRTSAEVLELPRFPSFSYNKIAETEASRFAGRVNAAAISEPEHKRLLEERQRLLDKELDQTITPEEKNRLAYVRWSLDRVDDARFGADMDRLESLVYRYERFQADMEQFHAELERLRKSRRSYP